jgi:hypothetical protein
VEILEQVETGALHCIRDTSHASTTNPDIPATRSCDLLDHVGAHLADQRVLIAGTATAANGANQLAALNRRQRLREILEISNG